MLLITSCEKDQLSAPGVVPGEAEIEQGIFDPLLNEGILCWRIISNEAVCGNAFFKEHLWFKPWILRRLVDYAGLTQKQIFDCLTSNVTSHEELKNRFIARYGKADEIKRFFAVWSF